MRTCLSIAIISSVMSFAACKSPMSVQMTESQMRRCEGDPAYLDYREGKARWSYTPGLELKAYFDVYEKYGDRRIFDFAEKWYDDLVMDDGNIRGYKIENYNIDHVCPGKSLLYPFGPMIPRALGHLSGLRWKWSGREKKFII